MKELWDTFFLHQTFSSGGNTKAHDPQKYLLTARFLSTLSVPRLTTPPAVQFTLVALDQLGACSDWLLGCCTHIMPLMHWQRCANDTPASQCLDRLRIGEKLYRHWCIIVAAFKLDWAIICRPLHPFQLSMSLKHSAQNWQQELKWGLTMAEGTKRAFWLPPLRHTCSLTLKSRSFSRPWGTGKNTSVCTMTWPGELLSRSALLTSCLRSRTRALISTLASIWKGRDPEKSRDLPGEFIHKCVLEMLQCPIHPKNNFLLN